VRDDFIIVVRGEKMKITTKIKDPFTLGQVLQQGRLQQGITQRELANLLGISQKWVWEMEQGKPGLLMERLFTILEKTGITLLAEFEIRDEQIT
jgi:transcriptional regulator with XRE-family HTH domain